MNDEKATISDILFYRVLHAGIFDMDDLFSIGSTRVFIDGVCGSGDL